MKPGGRLVIADYSFEDHRTRAREEQLKNHEIDPTLVRAEMEKAVSGSSKWKTIR